MSGKKFILWFRGLTIKDVPLVGGKNASLGEMYQKLSKKGIRVPDGFATTSDAYWYFLKTAKIKKNGQKVVLGNYLKETLKDLNINNIRNLKTRSEKIRKAILASELPKDFEAEIKNAYRRLSQEYQTKNVDVAVRSSATAEDLPTASFAGQQE